MKKDEELILCKIGEKINLKIHNIEIIKSKTTILKKEDYNNIGFFKSFEIIKNFIEENNVNENNYKEIWNIFDILYYGKINKEEILFCKFLYDNNFNNNDNDNDKGV